MEFIHHAVLGQHIYLPGNGDSSHIAQKQYIAPFEFTFGKSVSRKAGSDNLDKRDYNSQFNCVEGKGGKRYFTPYFHVIIPLEHRRYPSEIGAEYLRIRLQRSAQHPQQGH